MKLAIKDTLDVAREFIASGAAPKFLVATNTKTGHSILDNVPQLTCYGICPVRDVCYDVKLMKMRPSVVKARAERHYHMQFRPLEYAVSVVNEITLLKLSKVRIYGGGDFTPAHMPILAHILRSLPNVSFYMISKTIRSYPLLAMALLLSDNFFLNLSEAQGFHFGAEWNDIRNHSRVNTVYTLMATETDFSRAGAADIVFNVSKSAANITLYKGASLPLCPCDAHDIPREAACASCNLCSTKGGVRCAT